MQDATRPPVPFTAPLQIPRSGRLDSVRGQLIDLSKALQVRVAQEDRPDGVGDIGIPVLARELQSLRVVRVNFQCHVTRSCSGLHSLVVLKAGLDPVIVKLLGWFIQNELEVHFGATVFSNQLDKSGCAPSLF